MGHYIGKRLLTLIPVLLGITIFAFALGYLSPGDPVTIALASQEVAVDPSPELIEAMRHELGFDRPFPIQYFSWMGRVLQGDLGKSFITHESIAEKLRQGLPVTVALALIATFVTLVGGVVMGVAMGLHQNRALDRALSFCSTTLMSVPSFWIALLLMTFFSEHLRLLDTSGYEGPRSLIMPVLVLALGGIGSTARLTRANFIKQCEMQYVLVAGAKGLKQSVIAYGYALRNAILPVITATGNRLAGILGGSAVIESIFSLPGIGSYTLTAIGNRDYYVVQAYVLYTGVIYVLMNLAVDLIYFLLNPKIRQREGAA